MYLYTFDSRAYSGTYSFLLSIQRYFEVTSSHTQQELQVYAIPTGDMISYGMGSDMIVDVSKSYFPAVLPSSGALEDHPPAVR